MIENTSSLGLRIYTFIVFSSFEKKYDRKSAKSAILENSFSKIYPFNCKFKEKKNLPIFLTLKKF